MYLGRTIPIGKGGALKRFNPTIKQSTAPPTLVKEEPTTKQDLEKVVKNKPAMDKIISRLSTMKIKKKKISFEI